MRYLLLSDLHANWEALQAVLEDARGRYDRILCCGDIVGYGPDPNLVADWARSNLDEVIRGNHDRVCCGLEDLEWFNPVAQAASLWTMTQLTAANLSWLRGLGRGPLPLDGFSLAHGSPLDEDEYIASVSDAANIFGYLESNLTFFGHTHLQGGFEWAKGKIRKIAKPRVDQAFVRYPVDPDAAWLINPGSVGQPRDADPRAAYAIFEQDKMHVLLHRVPYHYGAVRRKIEMAGLPPALGARLAVGR